MLTALTGLLWWRSGHGAMRENHYLDDGAYSAVQTIIEMVRQALSGRSNDIGAAILADLTEPTESKEYRLKVCLRAVAWIDAMRMLHADCVAKPLFRRAG